MNLKKATQGFTLVEMLVVIAIISILAASLFPAISSAMDMARATSLKTRGKGIWNAIRVANDGREPLGKYSLWPKDLVDKKKLTSEKSLEYWKFLFSDGRGKIPEDLELQLVQDLSTSLLAGAGITAAATPDELSKDEKYVAWRVAVVNDNTPGELPFIVTKNYAGPTSFSGKEGVQQNEDEDAEPLDLDKEKKPFADKRAVWITIGGASKDARRRDFDAPTFLGNTEIKSGDKLDIWDM